MKTRKAAVIGLGHVGAHVAYRLAIQGIVSELVLDDLKQEFRANEAFKPLIAANGASGSGANGANGGAGQITKATDMSEAERIELAQTNPELFRKLFT